MVILLYLFVGSSACELAIASSADISLILLQIVNKFHSQFSGSVTAILFDIAIHEVSVVDRGMDISGAWTPRAILGAIY